MATQADVLSCGPVPSLRRAWIADRQIVERAGLAMQSGFGDLQLSRDGLQIAVAEQEPDAAQIGAVQQVAMEGSKSIQAWKVLRTDCICPQLPMAMLPSAARYGTSEQEPWLSP